MQDLASVKCLSARLRLSAFDQVIQAGVGHLGSCMSCVELVSAGFSTFDFPRSGRNGNDVFVLSKGHAAPVLYEAIYGPDQPIPFAGTGRCFPSHPNSSITPNVAVSTGSVGLGIAVAIGIATGLALQSKPGRVVVLAGDGELQTGIVWEALMNLSRRPRLPILLIVDGNGYQGGMEVPTNFIVQEMLRRLFSTVHSIDGHDLRAIMDVMEAFKLDSRATVLWGRTRRGAGVQQLEENPLPMTWMPSVSDREAIRSRLVSRILE